MQLSIHDYDNLQWVKDINISLATFGHIKYAKVNVNDVVILYDMNLRLAVPTVIKPTQLRYINSFIERNREEIFKILSKKYGKALGVPVIAKTFISTDKDVLGVSQMKHQLSFKLGTDMIDFYYDTTTKKYHIYAGSRGYGTAYADDLKLEVNSEVTEKQYRVISALLSYMVIYLRNGNPIELILKNNGYEEIYVNLRNDELDLRWTIKNKEITTTYFGMISDEEFSHYDDAVLGLIDMVYETGVYGLIEEVNRL